MTIIYANHERRILMKYLFIYHKILIGLIINIPFHNTFIYSKILNFYAQIHFFRGRERVGQLRLNVKEAEKCSKVNVYFF